MHIETSSGDCQPVGYLGAIEAAGQAPSHPENKRRAKEKATESYSSYGKKIFYHSLEKALEHGFVHSLFFLTAPPHRGKKHCARSFVQGSFRRS